MLKIKTINCAGCPKFCLEPDLKKLKSLVKKYKRQGYDGVVFNCEAGKQIIKELFK